MNYHILTLFPEMVTQGLSGEHPWACSKKGLLSVNAVNIRDYTADRHKKLTIILTAGSRHADAGTAGLRCMEGSRGENP